MLDGITEGLLDLSTDTLFLYFATFLLTMARVIGFFVQAPVWGSKHITMPIQMGFVGTLTIVIWPTIPIPHELPGGPITLMILVITQVFVGLVIGYISFIPLAMAQFGGEIMDTQMGISSAASYDPSSKGTINLIRRLKFYLGMIFYLFMNGHHELIHAFVRSFDIIPLTGARFSYNLIHHLIKISGQIIHVGIQIAIPVMGALFMVQIALGIMARVAPQMNVFMLSFPLNIMVGLTLLRLALPLFVGKLPSLFSYSFEWIKEALHYMVPK